MDALMFGQNGPQAIGDGTVASKLLANNLSVNALRTADVLRKDEWIAFDNALVGIARQKLVGITQLVQAGLVFNLNNAMGTTRVEWEDVSDMSPAEVNMSAVTQAENDRVTYNLLALPVPIVSKDFNLNIRALSASRDRGESLDMTQMEVAGRKVSELNESILYNGASLVSGGASVYGYTTALNRNTGSLTGDWSLVGQTGEIIVADVQAMMASLVADNMFGPYHLTVPVTYYAKLGNDYKAASDKTILQRILEIPGISGVTASASLSGGGTGEVLLVQMTKDVVDLVLGQQPTAVQWDSAGGFIKNFKVLSIMVPRMKSDSTGQSGIAHYSV